MIIFDHQDMKKYQYVAIFGFIHSPQKIKIPPSCYKSAKMEKEDIQVYEELCQIPKECIFVQRRT